MVSHNEQGLQAKGPSLLAKHLPHSSSDPQRSFHESDFEENEGEEEGSREPVAVEEEDLLEPEVSAKLKVLAQFDLQLVLLVGVCEADVLLDAEEEADGEGGHADIIGAIEEVIIDSDGTVAIGGVEVEDVGGVQGALEDVPHREVQKIHRILPPMPEQQSSQISELRKGEVGKARSLVPLLPIDPDANVGRLDHVDVVSPISDGQGH
mmetsp:Transcript_3804/g.3715  ORF Transcript_3804/g.3715 Transcript_3804/m.3715 type:complete len:208 (+) Transcript_3804:304-927(+)